MNILLKTTNTIIKDVVLKMKVTKEQYNEMAGEKSPASPIWKDMFLAFIFGGGICTIGQALCQLYMMTGMDKKTSNTWVSITLIELSVILTALNWYGKIAKYAGAGTIVPITGFANSIAAPAIEFKSEGHIFGIGAKMFIMAGPVIVFGTVSSMIYGFIVWVFKLY